MQTEISWNDKADLGEFKIKSARNKNAHGRIIKLDKASYQVLLKDHNYSKNYIKTKLRKSLSEVIEEDEVAFYITEYISCERGYIYTDSSSGDGLIIGRSYRFDDEIINYCNNGAHNCGGGEFISPPTCVVYKGKVWGNCDGEQIIYSKFLEILCQ